MAEKKNPVGLAVQAINKAMTPFPDDVAAHALSIMAGAWAGQTSDIIKRYAALGLSIETMVQSCIETAKISESLQRSAKRISRKRKARGATTRKRKV